MPKVKPLTYDDELCEVLKCIPAKIRYFQCLAGYDMETIARCAGMGKATLSRRMNNPGDFTLKELYMLEHRLKIPMNTLLEPVK